MSAAREAVERATTEMVRLLEGKLAKRLRECGAVIVLARGRAQGMASSVDAQETIQMLARALRMAFEEHGIETEERVRFLASMAQMLGVAKPAEQDS